MITISLLPNPMQKANPTRILGEVRIGSRTTVPYPRTR